MNIMRKAISWLALLLVALFTSVPKAAAALDDNTVIDRLTDRYQSVANQWGSVITGHATTIFWILVVISLVWTFGMLALRRADIGEFIAEAVRFIMFTGFYFWILRNGTTFAKQIIDSLFQIGQQSTAADHQLMPSDMVAVGFKIYDKTFASMNWMNVAGSVVAGVLAIVILIVLAYVGVNIMLALLSSWILMYAGVIYLGFGGCRWTSDLAINYYRAVLGIGVKVMVMMLIIGIAARVLGDCFNEMSNDLNVRELGVILVLVIAIAMLSAKVPDMVAGIVSGSGAHYGAGHLALGTVMGAAMMAGTMAARTVVAVAGGGAGAFAALGGGGQALRAAFESAQQHIGNGVGGNGGSNDRGGIVSGLTTASRFSGHMASSLVQGVSASAKTGMKGVSTNMQNRVAQTFPGKVASAIRERSHTSSTNTPAKEPVQESPMTADQARGFHGPESIPDVRAEAQDFINGSRGSEMT
jgi:type IV secretion system protein TrbL